MTREFKGGRRIACRLPHQGDLLLAITEIAREHKIRMGSLSCIGALSKFRFAFYDQKEKKYGTKELSGDYEILACIGNISIKDGESMCHAHITVADEEGRAFGGHLVEGCTIFAGELILEELLGEPLERTYDDVTGLNLWRFK